MRTVTTSAQPSCASSWPRLCAVLVGVGLCALSAWPLAGQATLVQPLQQHTHLLGVSDQVSIWSLGLDEFNDRRFTVDNNGDLNLPLIGRVRAAGLSLSDLEGVLEARMRTYVQEPQVTVSLTEHRSHPVSVLGAVTTPGVYQLEGRRTLMELLSQAGGLREDAGHKVTLVRRREWGPIAAPKVTEDINRQVYVAEIEIAGLLNGTSALAELPIQPRDVITVGLSEMVYVVGEVRKPGGYTLRAKERITVLQALSLAEGVQRTASLKHARILRGVPGTTDRTEIPIDLSKVLTAKGEDVAMQPNDILFVPNSAARSATFRTLEAALQITTGVIIWRR
jgi:polysaccharide biosynthesis/export protein